MANLVWTEEQLNEAARNLVRHRREADRREARERFVRLLENLRRADAAGAFDGFEGRVFLIGSAVRPGDFFPHSDFDFVVVGPELFPSPVKDRELGKSSRSFIGPDGMEMVGRLLRYFGEEEVDVLPLDDLDMPEKKKREFLEDAVDVRNSFLVLRGTEDSERVRGPLRDREFLETRWEESLRALEEETEG